MFAYAHEELMALPLSELRSHFGNKRPAMFLCSWMGPNSQKRPKNSWMKSSPNGAPKEITIGKLEKERPKPVVLWCLCQLKFLQPNRHRAWGRNGGRFALWVSTLCWGLQLNGLLDQACPHESDSCVFPILACFRSANLCIVCKARLQSNQKISLAMQIIPNDTIFWPVQNRIRNHLVDSSHSPQLFRSEMWLKLCNDQPIAKTFVLGLHTLPSICYLFWSSSPFQQNIKKRKRNVNVFGDFAKTILWIPEARDFRSEARSGPESEPNDCGELLRVHLSSLALFDLQRISKKLTNKSWFI